MVTCPDCRGAKRIDWFACGAAGAGQRRSVVASVRVRVWWTRPARHRGARAKEGAGTGAAA